MATEYSIQRDGQRLRCGVTTGTCAALAAQAATAMLLEQRVVGQASLRTPGGLVVTADVLHPTFGPDAASCAVRKDAGDDVDCTDGVLIFADAAYADCPGVQIDGGEGVGRVTRPGLEQPVGSAAINRVPRAMIAAAVGEACERCGFQGGIAVTVRAPGGEEIASKTFNPRLGIAGGLSILGTTGIVEPRSIQAMIDTIGVEMRMLAANGKSRILATPGNYGESFLKEHPPGESMAQVTCANLIGETLDFAAELGFEQLVLVGHAGKFVKLAAGVMNTHSRCADARREVLAAHAGAAGGGAALCRALLEAGTVDECIALLDEQGLRAQVLAAVLESALEHLRRRAGAVQVELAMFSNRYGPLCWTRRAGILLGLEDRA